LLALSELLLAQPSVPLLALLALLVAQLVQPSVPLLELLLAPL